MLARLGRRDDALTAYRAAVEKGADQLEGPIAPPVFHDALRNVEEARAAYAERLESRRDDPNTWRRAGQTFLAAQMSQESLEAYDTMIRLVPNEPDAWSGKAEALVQAGRISEAIAAYEQALRIRPGYQPVAIRLRVVRATSLKAQDLSDQAPGRHLSRRGRACRVTRKPRNWSLDRSLTCTLAVLDRKTHSLTFRDRHQVMNVVVWPSGKGLACT